MKATGQARYDRLALMLLGLILLVRLPLALLVAPPVVTDAQGYEAAAFRLAENGSFAFPLLTSGNWAVEDGGLVVTEAGRSGASLRSAQRLHASRIPRVSSLMVKAAGNTYDSRAWTRLAQAILSVLSAGLIYLIGRRFGARTGAAGTAAGGRVSAVLDGELVPPDGGAVHLPAARKRVLVRAVVGLALVGRCLGGRSRLRAVAVGSAGDGPVGSGGCGPGGLARQTATRPRRVAGDRHRHDDSRRDHAVVGPQRWALQQVRAVQHQQRNHGHRGHPHGRGGPAAVPVAVGTATADARPGGDREARRQGTRSRRSARVANDVELNAHFASALATLRDTMLRDYRGAAITSRLRSFAVSFFWPFAVSKTALGGIPFLVSWLVHLALLVLFVCGVALAPRRTDTWLLVSLPVYTVLLHLLHHPVPSLLLPCDACGRGDRGHRPRPAAGSGWGGRA